ncbi:MAG: hypothetical protein JNM27_23170 [Leptospirales bacterium]|nr:hypothetical protein [Leptospirales bacterium]
MNYRFHTSSAERAILTIALVLLAAISFCKTAPTPGPVGPGSDIRLRDEWERAGCILDRAKLCKTETSVDGALACLGKRETELSDDCKLELGIIKKSDAPYLNRNACDQERQTICYGRQGVSAGKCLYDNESRVSEVCRAHLKDRRDSRARQKKFNTDCGKDLRAHCGSVSGEHPQYACLRTKQEQLSAACKSHMHD